MELGGSWCYRGPLTGPWWYQPGPQPHVNPPNLGFQTLRLQKWIHHSIFPTEPFAIPQPQDQEISDFGLPQIRSTSDFEAPELWKGRTGRFLHDQTPDFDWARFRNKWFWLSLGQSIMLTCITKLDYHLQVSLTIRLMRFNRSIFSQNTYLNYPCLSYDFNACEYQNY